MKVHFQIKLRQDQSQYQQINRSPSLSKKSESVYSLLVKMKIYSKKELHLRTRKTSL